MNSLCDPIETQNDVDNFFETVAGNFEGVVQYNKDNRAFEVKFSSFIWLFFRIFFLIRVLVQLI
jgi:hypothetical protein